MVHEPHKRLPLVYRGVDYTFGHAKSTTLESLFAEIFVSVLCPSSGDF